MGSIYLKPVEYPQEKVLEFEELTEEGKKEIKRQAQEIIDEVI